MGGTSGGPQALPTPPASNADAPAAGGPAPETADIDDGGYYGDPIGPDGPSTGLPAPLPPSFLTDGVGLGQPNLPDDVFLTSSLMAENGLLDAPTRVATPEYTDGLKTAQELLGTTPDGFALKGGETDLAALQGAREGAVRLPATFASLSGPSIPPVQGPSGPTVARAVSTPGRSMTQQVATVRKMKAEEASAKAPAVMPVGPRLSNPMDLVAAVSAPRIATAPAAVPTLAKIDPIKAASEFRHIATFRPGKFERNDAGTPTLQGVPLDTTKAELMEHALKARGANDLDTFEAMLKRRGNSLTGPEKDFLRGVAENRFENTSDRDFDALTAGGMKTMGLRLKAGSAGELPVDARPSIAAERMPKGPERHDAPVFEDEEQAELLKAARSGGAQSSKNVIARIQGKLVEDGDTLKRLDPELRTFYTAYQTHLRTQPYTTDKDALAKRERSAIAYAHEALGATKVGQAFAQGTLGTGADVIEGAGHLTGNEDLTRAGRDLRARIEAAFPVPPSLRDTASVQSAEGLGKAAPAVALGGAGVAGGAAARAGATVLSGAAGAGAAARDLARQGAPTADQRIAAFAAAVSETIGPKGGRLMGRQVNKLAKRFLGLDLSSAPKAELNALNQALAPKGLMALADRGIQMIDPQVPKGDSN